VVSCTSTGKLHERNYAPYGLGAGELRRLVLAFLADRPGQALSPTAIAKALGRSAGAVSNALTVLASQGAVVQTQVKPRRYTLAQQTEQAGVTG
jgi:nitric oxide reductase NorQ protein